MTMTDEPYISLVPNGIDLEVTIEFLSGSAITSTTNCTASGWVVHPDGRKFAANSASVTASNKIRLMWTYGSLPSSQYEFVGYLTPAAGTPVECARGYIVVNDYVGP